jgi:hypothetical protein
MSMDPACSQKGIPYKERYAPVASWNSIHMLLKIMAIHKWHTKQLDYVLAFPQAPVKKELYMSIPKGFEIDKGCTDECALQLHRNMYKSKQAGCGTSIWWTN